MRKEFPARSSPIGNRVFFKEISRNFLIDGKYLIDRCRHPGSTALPYVCMIHIVLCQEKYARRISDKALLAAA